MALVVPEEGQEGEEEDAGRRQEYEFVRQKIEELENEALISGLVV